MPRPVRALLLLAAVTALAGCRDAGSATSAGTGGPIPGATKRDSLAQCSAQLTYWTKDSLASPADRGLDYQEMGLSSAAYDELRGLIGDARAALAAGPLPESWLDDHAAAACRRIAALPTPTASRAGWP